MTDAMSTGEGPVQCQVAGFTISYDLTQGIQLFAGTPTISMWTETSMAGLMLGLSRMVGVERFNLAMQSGGRDSVDGDMEFISRSPTFEEGFAKLALVAAAAGWGLWEIVSLDRQAKRGTFRCRNSWEGMYQRALCVCWGSAMVAGKFAGHLTHLFGENCWAQQTAFQARGDEFDEFLVYPSNQTIEGDLENLLDSDAATRADLAVALERLRKEVEERRSAEEALKRTEQENLFLITEQRNTIAAMSTPIIQVWEGILTVPIVGQISAARAATLMQQLLDAIVTRSATYAILDLTGVDNVDAETADHLLRIMRAAELLGTKAIVSGIRPKVAQTIVELGVDLASLATAANLEEGLKWCLRSMGVRGPVKMKTK